MSDFNNWLAGLESLGLRDDFPPLMVGSNYSLQWEIQEHPILGDFTDGEFIMEIKAAPGIAGAAMATATVVSGEIADGFNPVSITVPVADQDGLLIEGDPSYINRVATIIYVPPGGSGEIVRGGLFPVGAGVTGVPE